MDIARRLDKLERAANTAGKVPSWAYECVLHDRETKKLLHAVILRIFEGAEDELPEWLPDMIKDGDLNAEAKVVFETFGTREAWDLARRSDATPKEKGGNDDGQV
jgi:hypothetical protein